jgi:uncharacterized protein (DUF2235 family)
MSKRLIVCADGTWNDEDRAGATTNVAKLHADVQTHYVEGVSQWAYYHSGVGTRWGERLSGGAFGSGINRNILDCYTFLVENYAPGDELYLFGFSRGAYTVRSVAGLIRNSGIVRDPKRIREAFALYRSRGDDDHPTGKNALAFRQTHAHGARAHLPRTAFGYDGSPEIRFIGVWDTVGALGYPLPFFAQLKPLLALVGLDWWFHDVDLSTTVKYAYHAVAIHERRSDFTPTLWKQQLDGGTPKRPDQILEQVYFPGVHCDVGGGYGAAALSDATYRWMVEKAAATGLLVRSSARSPGPHLAPDPLGRVHESFSGVFAVTDALRLRFHGKPRTFPADPASAASIADSAVERFKRLPTSPWPVAGGANSLKARIEALSEGVGGDAAPVLSLLRSPGSETMH